MALILSSPHLHTRPLGCRLHPIIHPPSDKHVVTSQCPFPPLTTTINIFIPLNGSFLINECCFAARSWVSRCPSKHPFCPQKSALSSCSQSPWWWPFGWNLDKLGNYVLKTITLKPPFSKLLIECQFVFNSSNIKYFKITHNYPNSYLLTPKYQK